MHGRLFDTGRSFPLPRALSALTDAFGFAIGLDAKAALVVAHTNAVGDDANSDPLSLERAEILAAWLEGKKDAGSGTLRYRLDPAPFSSSTVMGPTSRKRAHSSRTSMISW